MKREADEQRRAVHAEMAEAERKAEKQAKKELKRQQEERQAMAVYIHAQSEAMQRNAEAKRREEEEARAAKLKAEEAEAVRRAELAEKARQRNVEKAEAKRKGLLIAGGFCRQDTVFAAQDIKVSGKLVVRKGAQGTVLGPSVTNPLERVTVAFARREDAGEGNLNVLPREVRSSRP